MLRWMPPDRSERKILPKFTAKPRARSGPLRNTVIREGLRHIRFGDIARVVLDGNDRHARADHPLRGAFREVVVLDDESSPVAERT